MDLEQFATNVYFDRTFDCEAAKILPGEYYFTNKDMLIVTVLGSCVSACIRDRVTGLGGMNHFMLPDGGGDGSPVSASARYGTYAMEILINDSAAVPCSRALRRSTSASATPLSC
jgi:chemotaxis protein CheD